MTVNGENITYLYDANDSRMYKQVDTTLEEYYLKDLGVLDMKTGNWTYYASGTERFLRIEPDSVHQPKYNASIDSIGISNGERFYYETDHLGNTRIVFTPRDVYFKYIHFASDFYPYGLALRQYISVPEKYQLTGKQRDEETDLDYFGARFFDSEIGRFESVDGLQNKFPAWSPYNYTMDNPIKFVDPTGNAPEDWVESINGNIYWDENATSQATTKDGETYLGKNVVVATHNRDANGNEPINTATFDLYLESDKTGMSATMKGNTVPADITKSGTLAEGLYSAKFGHRNKETYKNELALRIYNLDGTDGLPTLNGNPNPSSNGKTLTGVLLHMGNNYQTSMFDSRGHAYTEGCQTGGCFPGSREIHNAFMKKVGRDFKGVYYLRANPVLNIPPPIVPFYSDMPGTGE